MKCFLTMSLILIFCGSAQGEVGHEIVVTGSRLSSGDYYDMPAVTIKRKADFLVQRIRLINDSRSPKLRKKEIIKTIDNLLKASRKNDDIELSYGEGFLVPVNLNDDSLQLIEDHKRSDTSYVNIYVKVVLDESRSSKQQISELRSFIADAKLISRTEIEYLGDIGLSIVSPEQYRYEILKKISAENDKIKKLVGGDCTIKIGGLEGRVEWERSDVAELTLYIAYATEVSCS
ncbi:hypothetical protein [Aliikangiella coralliicola]|uniref:DUF541 domain-containing protein n=1 Tax=Aliikangiella coralliicola TaxID=2592383 RepID=A0A545UI20_9GAMM|nr:hypothetical protein [Aliikangiella coralliicola]TQV89116.1 hypothetical protein FLL46_03035 [Aliikangiella coralliicola]